MRLRDMPIQKAERVLFDVLAISTAVKTNNQKLKSMIVSGEKISSSLEEIKAVALNLEGNSYGWLRGNQLKYFKEDFRNANQFVRENL
jgi:hypothetical protein